MIKAYAVFEPGGELKPFEYDPGELGQDEVEIDVQYCGICHSDVSMIDNTWGNAQYPLVPGHEVAGTIAKVGDKVTHLKVGQSVGLGWHAGYCNDCRHCDNGDHNFCADKQAVIVDHHGGFADKVRAQAKSVVPIPDGMPLEAVGPLFCGGNTVFNPMVQFDLKPTSKVAVIGIGGLGHMALQFLNAWGCEVTAFTHTEAKKKEALELGAHHTLDSRDQNEIAKAAGHFDFIISTVNVKLDWNLYLGTLAPRGRLHFVGVVLEPLDINVFPLMMRQNSLSGSPVGSPETIRKMLDFANLHNIRPVVQEYPFEQVNEAISALRKGDVRYRAVLSHK